MGVGIAVGVEMRYAVNPYMYVVVGGRHLRGTWASTPSQGVGILNRTVLFPVGVAEELDQSIRQWAPSV